MVWGAVLKFSAVANMRFGPRKSGVWGCRITEAHARLCERLRPDDPGFMQAAEDQHELEPTRFGDASSVDYESWFQYFTCLPFCTSTPAAVVKFSRWHSIGDVWP